MFELIFIILLVLKLLKKINISWFWVFAPLTIPLAILMVPFIAFLAVMFSSGVLK